MLICFRGTQCTFHFKSITCKNQSIHFGEMSPQAHFSNELGQVTWQMVRKKKKKKKTPAVVYAFAKLQIPVQ